ncbi:MAG: IS30 family transposase [Patescibacteria group bacterium]
MHYHLTQTNRIELSLLYRLGYSMRQVAAQLGVAASTVSRELRRNARASGQYYPNSAKVLVRARREAANGLRTKLLGLPQLAAVVEQKLKANWSPEQVAGWLKASQHTFRVCTQTIYDWIYRFRRDLLTHLHCRKGKYRRTRENAIRKAFRDKQKESRRITARPACVLNRRRYGHWEGDTVRGKGNSGCIATFVERKSGYLLAVKLERATAAAFAQAATSSFAAVSLRYKQTLTLDNGTEMSNYEEMEQSTGMRLYFAHPYHSWERGTNENTNGLLRFYFPKQMASPISRNSSLTLPCVRLILGQGND